MRDAISASTASSAAFGACSTIRQRKQQADFFAAEAEVIRNLERRAA
jgi:hypothetical protein